MRKTVFISLMTLMLGGSAQAQGVWEVPQQQEKADSKAQKLEKKSEDERYLRGAVPVVDGRVTWKLDVPVENKNATELYDRMLEIMTAMTREEGQLEDSKVSLVNHEQHTIVATMREWIVFKSNAIMLDRAKMSYVFTAECTDGKVHVVLSRFKYDYDERPRHQFKYKAEEWITDEVALNKRGTRLYPVSAKFRRKTIDRKDEIFARIQTALTR